MLRGFRRLQVEGRCCIARGGGHHSWSEERGLKIIFPF
jgi:hypothetical protein